VKWKELRAFVALNEQLIEVGCSSRFGIECESTAVCRWALRIRR